MIIFTKFHKDCKKIVDFSLMANFWQCLGFFFLGLYVPTYALDLKYANRVMVSFCYLNYRYQNVHMKKEKTLDSKRWVILTLVALLRHMYTVSAIFISPLSGDSAASGRRQRRPAKPPTATNCEGVVDESIVEGHDFDKWRLAKATLPLPPHAWMTCGRLLRRMSRRALLPSVALLSEKGAHETWTRPRSIDCNSNTNAFTAACFLLSVKILACNNVADRCSVRCTLWWSR